MSADRPAYLSVRQRIFSGGAAGGLLVAVLWAGPGVWTAVPSDDVVSELLLVMATVSLLRTFLEDAYEALVGRHIWDDAS